MNAYPLEELRRRLNDFTDEALIEFYVEECGEFTEMALDMIRGELLRRGYRPAELEAGRKTPGQGRDPEEAILKEKIVSIGLLHDMPSVDQVVQVLEEEGIPAFTKGIEYGIWGYRSYPPNPGPLYLFVLKSDAPRAKEILDNLFPDRDE